MKFLRLGQHVGAFKDSLKCTVENDTQIFRLYYTQRRTPSCNDHPVLRLEPIFIGMTEQFSAIQRQWQMVSAHFAAYRHC